MLLTTPVSAVELSAFGNNSDSEALESTSKSVELAQVTTVSELSDVQPGDWAFTSLQRLVEEYGCLEGYPDRTFRGNRALTRFEFAAGLNACLDVVIQLIGGGSQVEEIRRLQEEFAAELATIRGRVDTLETDIAELEANQFSTTTQLRAQLDAHLVVPFDELETDGGEADATFEYRARLNFDTSFTGDDRLRIRLQASDDADSVLAVSGGLADQSGAFGGIEDNVGLDDIFYAFPVGERLNVEIAANSRANSNFVSSLIVPYARPAVAEFGEDGFYESGFDQDSSLGIGVNYEITDDIILDLAYSTETANDNTSDGGLFNNYEYLVQLNYLSDGLIDAAVTFQDGEVDGGTVDYVVAGALNLDFGRFELGGYYAFIEDDAGDSDEWQIGTLVPDLFVPGNDLGIYGGVQSSPNSNPVIIEGFYTVNVSEFFTVTPAILYGDLDTGADDDEGVYGVIRTTFKF
ncbi:MAG: iron uptake porin [Cyanobacteria bacterium J06614_10]